MTLTVSDKKFNIKFTPMIVHDIYEEIIELTSKLVDIPTNIEDQGILAEDEAKDKTLAEKIKIKQRYSVIVKDFMKDVKEIKTAICDKRFKAIEIMLVKNGYTFDKRWWEEDIDIECHNDFFMACVQKDYEPKTIAKEKN